SEPVNILARHRWLFRFGAALDSDAIPRIRYVAVKFAGIQAMHDAPCAPAKRHRLFSLPRPLAFGTGENFIVDFVRADRRHRPDLAVTQLVTSLGHDALDDLHRALVVRARARRDLFQIYLAAPGVLTQPPN